MAPAANKSIDGMGIRQAYMKMTYEYQLIRTDLRCETIAPWKTI